MKDKFIVRAGIVVSIDCICGNLMCATDKGANDIYESDMIKCSNKECRYYHKPIRAGLILGELYWENQEVTEEEIEWEIENEQRRQNKQ